MSDNDRPDLAAVRELQVLIRALGEEMAAWRRRAQLAEAKLKEVQSAPPPPPPPVSRTPGAPVTPAQAALLEGENAELRTRLDSASGRTRQLLDRMRFLRQQHEAGVER
ncbi:MAG: hypothetical protein ACREON_11935 [Gemmatimonadaceae bacterium]